MNIIHTREKGNLEKAKGKREKSGPQDLVSKSTTQPDRTHAHTQARTNETRRNDFPVGLIPQPPILAFDQDGESAEKSIPAFPFHPHSLDELFANPCALQIERY